VKKIYFGSLVVVLSVAAVACSHTDTRTTDNGRVDTTNNKNALGYDKDHGYGTDRRDAATTRGDKEYPALHVAKIDFNRGGAALTQAEKNEIASLIKNARAKGKIEEVKILAWADQDYSMNKDANKAPSAAIDLADARAKAIRSYIREALDFSDIDSHNMAARPGVMSKLFKTEDYQIKNGTYDADGTPFKAAPAPQKALVVVEMEGDRT
jgi:hypothetical protein